MARTAYYTQWYRDNAERLRAKARTRYYDEREEAILRNSTYSKRIRLEVMQHYSQSATPFCACCGEDRYIFLCIDHVNNDGGKHRKENGIRPGGGTAGWLKKNGYPEDFQVLCYNCNNAKEQLGICPHISEVDALITGGG